jgi:hypothetical protein
VRRAAKAAAEPGPYFRVTLRQACHYYEVVMYRAVLIAALPLACLAAPCTAREMFVGVYKHAVDTPFTLYTGEGGMDLELGYRFDRLEALRAIGKPAPYVIASLNSRGDTSFAGAGLGWKLGKGPVYVRPGIGLIVHTGPSLRVGSNGVRTDLGSPVLFEPEMALGLRVSPKVAVEASWTHISNGRVFNQHQNPGIDMMGVRLAFALK